MTVLPFMGAIIMGSVILFLVAVISDRRKSR